MSGVEIAIPGHDLVARPVDFGDAEEWFAFAMLPEVRRHTRCTIASVDDVRAIIARCRSGEPSAPISFALRRTSDRRLAGTIEQFAAQAFGFRIVLADRVQYVPDPALLIGMPGVRDCAVFGIPDAEYGERLCACVEPETGAQLSAAAVQAFLRERLANFKVPKEVQFLDALPREAIGKIFKRKLRDPYWANHS